MKRSGTADLPLHGGRVPAWLASRMTLLGTAIAEHIILNYGPTEFLTRLSDPFWFQAFGCVMGMDWHSSGITTSVMGALKRGLNSRFNELGISVCGGRGRHSKNTPDELREISNRTGLDGERLARTSRLTARVDNNAVADGFQIYLHSFVITKSGEWAVIQQGMNAESHLARRYHWHSAWVRDFTSEPHTAIVGQPQGTILNLVDRRATQAQSALLSIAKQPVANSLAEIRKLAMPDHHDVRAEDIDLKRLGAVLAVAHEQELRDFASLLLVEGLGPRTLQSLALVAEIIHGAPSRFSDPARFSFAHGGKDGHPFPVPLKTYDETLDILRRSLSAAGLQRTEKIEGFRRLDRLTRTVEANLEPLADFTAALRQERATSRELGGRTVADDLPHPRKPAQFLLF
ncbi:MAG TPA: DUF763 domain-containing protein [Candidatus Saccharimonadales bacterium]|jgi:hypothetical protein|nr:DUF763 domain-containing protein [Candidatus Saccharimonadales bacterium]